jgi:hypothetical protein
MVRRSCHVEGSGAGPEEAAPRPGGGGDAVHGIGRTAFPIDFQVLDNESTLASTNERGFPMRWVDFLSAVTGASSAMFLALALAAGNVTLADQPITHNCSANTCNCPNDCLPCDGGGNCHCDHGSCIDGAGT